MTKDDDALVKEMRAIKLLLVLQLLRQGARQSQIAAMLGVSERTLGRMLPLGAARGGKAVAEDE